MFINNKMKKIVKSDQLIAVHPIITQIKIKLLKLLASPKSNNFIENYVKKIVY